MLSTNMAALARQVWCRASSYLTSARSSLCNPSSLAKASTSSISSTTTSALSQIGRQYGINSTPSPLLNLTKSTGLLSQCLRVYQQAPLPMTQQVRTKIYFSIVTGGPKNVRCVTQRFFRLGNGLWIRTRPGRGKSKYKKSGYRLALLDRHVFCTRRQCQMLDKMAGKSFKERKHYMNDPYEIYHRKDMLPIFRTKARQFYP